MKWHGSLLCLVALVAGLLAAEPSAHLDFGIRLDPRGLLMLSSDIPNLAGKFDLLAVMLCDLICKPGSSLAD